MLRTACLLLLLVDMLCRHVVDGFQLLSLSAQVQTMRFCIRRNMVVPAGADIEKPPLENKDGDTQASSSLTSTVPSATSSAFGSTSGDDSVSVSMRRGKVNEINFCMAPADASLSRAYGGTFSASSIETNSVNGELIKNNENNIPASGLSLTRALNNASNRVVRRILLARSWPSAEALNLSLRRVAEAERETAKQQEAAAVASSKEVENNNNKESAPKCPVPRPILNVLTRKRAGEDEGGTTSSTTTRPRPLGRTDAEYVADQLDTFRERYGSLPGYGYAEAYLDSILSLATSGVESPRVQEVLDDGVYDDAYRRIKGVLRTVGAVFVEDPETGRARISKKLVDQDICLSIIDKINIKRELALQKSENKNSEQGKDSSVEIGEPSELNSTSTMNNETLNEQKQTMPKLRFWKKKQDAQTIENSVNTTDSNEESAISREDLGGVLLSAEEPTMTRQLNVLSNIVLRALLFGGSQELLVLAETLDADRTAFVERWYVQTDGPLNVEVEKRAGVQFFNCLVALLRNCYNFGVVTDLQPPLPLVQSYANAYERLVATAVELGSGCLKPAMTTDVMTMPTPRTATEELGRFAVWETDFRAAKSAVSAHPEDLQGEWEVRDVIGSETIGVSKVQLCENGQVELAEPLEGLRWRCDPGPTHLDTCTFQVLASDGTILQYRGFIDRGARLEARVSKRPISCRGSVMFQMRDGSIDYFKDMLPINYREGATNFVMTKIVERQ